MNKINQCPVCDSRTCECECTCGLCFNFSAPLEEQLTIVKPDDIDGMFDEIVDEEEEKVEKVEVTKPKKGKKADV
jgi:hypothetical protein